MAVPMPSHPPQDPHDCALHPNVACLRQVRELLRQERARLARLVRMLAGQLPVHQRLLIGNKIEAIAQLLEDFE